MTTIDLNNLNKLPKYFLDELKKHDLLFIENNFLENVLENNSIRNLIQNIHVHCLENEVVGYHYTRAIPSEISKMGLTCRKGENIRNTFLTNFAHLFTAEEVLRIKEAWAAHFNERQQKSRDNCLFFNFTTMALGNYGAAPLLLNFGGEQVYMPLHQLHGIGEKIKNIGKPLILKCTLDPNLIRTFFEYSWGRIAVSTYHCQINKNAHQEDQDGYQYFDVKPENIEIIEYDQEKYYR